MAGISFEKPNVLTS